jgi:hypothetical protein
MYIDEMIPQARAASRQRRPTHAAGSSHGSMERNSLAVINPRDFAIRRIETQPARRSQAARQMRQVKQRTQETTRQEARGLQDATPPST